jgi:hypothetical protein
MFRIVWPSSIHSTALKILLNITTSPDNTKIQGTSTEKKMSARVIETLTCSLFDLRSANQKRISEFLFFKSESENNLLGCRILEWQSVRSTVFRMCLYWNFNKCVQNTDSPTVPTLEALRELEDDNEY